MMVRMMQGFGEEDVVGTPVTDGGEKVVGTVESYDPETGWAQLKIEDQEVLNPLNLSLAPANKKVEVIDLTVTNNRSNDK